VSFFFALLDARTPGSAERMAASSDAIMRMLLVTELSDVTKFFDVHRKRIGDASDDTIEQLRQEMLQSVNEGRIEFRDPRAHALSMSLRCCRRCGTYRLPDAQVVL
jgi:hypothetical protein